MKFKEFFETLATESPQQRYAALLARRKAGLPFATPEDKDFFLRFAQQQQASMPQTATPRYQPMQTPEERANADFETLQNKNKTRQPMTPEERARLMMYYNKKQSYDKKFDRQQGWGEATTLDDGKQS
jgi:hypothetical protein